MAKGPEVTNRNSEAKKYTYRQLANGVALGIVFGFAAGIGLSYVCSMPEKETETQKKQALTSAMRVAIDAGDKVFLDQNNNPYALGFQRATTQGISYCAATATRIIGYDSKGQPSLFQAPEDLGMLVQRAHCMNLPLPNFPKSHF